MVILNIFMCKFLLYETIIFWFYLAEKLAPLKLDEKEESDDDEFIGPPIPKDLVAGTSEPKKDDDEDSDDEIIGPLPPKIEAVGDDEDSDADSEDDEEAVIEFFTRENNFVSLKICSLYRPKFLPPTKCKCCMAQRLCWLWLWTLQVLEWPLDQLTTRSSSGTSKEWTVPAKASGQ